MALRYYWYDPGSDVDDLSVLGHWWLDEAHTQPAGAPPDWSADTLVLVEVPVWINPGHPIQAGARLIVRGYGLGLAADLACEVTVEAGSSLESGSSGNSMAVTLSGDLHQYGTISYVGGYGLVLQGQVHVYSGGVISYPGGEGAMLSIAGPLTIHPGGKAGYTGGAEMDVLGPVTVEAGGELSLCGEAGYGTHYVLAQGPLTVAPGARVKLMGTELVAEDPHQRLGRGIQVIG